MAPRVGDRNWQGKHAALLQQRTLQKSSKRHEILAENKAKVARAVSLQDKSLRESISKAKDSSNPIAKAHVKRLMLMQQQLKLAGKFVRLTMKNVELQKFHPDGPLTPEESRQHVFETCDILEIVRVVPLGLRMLLLDKLKEQFGTSRPLMLGELQAGIFLPLMRAQAQQKNVGSDHEQPQLYDCFTEEDILMKLAQGFELATQVASSTAEDVLTGVVRKLALAYPAAEEETLSEHLECTSLSN